MKWFWERRSLEEKRLRAGPGGQGQRKMRHAKTMERLLSERQKENRNAKCYGNKGIKYFKK